MNDSVIDPNPGSAAVGALADSARSVVDVVTDGPVLMLSGDFDGRSTWVVRSAIDDLLRRYDDVVVDLSGVAILDLTAIKVLAAASRRAAAQGHHLSLRGCCPAVRRLLHLSGLRRLLDVDHAATA